MCSQILIVNSNGFLASSIDRYYSNQNSAIKYAGINSNEILESDSQQLLYNKSIFEKGSSELFKDKIATFYTSYKFNDIDKDEVLKKDLERFPSLIDLHLKLPHELSLHKDGDNLFNKPYTNFETAIMEIFPQESYNVKWNHFELSEIKKNKRKNIFLFNIQSGSKIFWEQTLEDIFSISKIENSSFIFYWYSGISRKENRTEARIKRIKYEAEDVLWGYSRFLRDFLSVRGVASEITLNSDGTSQEIENHLKEKLYSELDSNNVIDFSNLKNIHSKILETLLSIYGNNINEPACQLLGGLETPNIKNYSMLYLFNKNNVVSQIKVGEPLTMDDYVEFQDGHNLLREIDEKLSQYDMNKGFFEEFGKINYIFHFRKTISALIRAMLFYKDYDEIQAPRFLFVDDNKELLTKKIKTFEEWFTNSNIYYMDGDVIELVRNIILYDDISDIEFDLCKTDGAKVSWKSLLREFQDYNKNRLKRSKKPRSFPLFIVIDLDFNGNLLGLDLLRKVKSQFNSGVFEPFIIYPIVLSRFEEPYIIRRAINEGALYYITKSNYLRMVYKIYSLKNIDNALEKQYTKYENWHGLNKLDPSKIHELKSSKIHGSEYSTKSSPYQWHENYQYSNDYLWIKKLPKAELHCHIGSSLGPDLIPRTALVVLAEKYFKNKEFYDNNEVLDKIIKFLAPIVNDPFLDEREHKDIPTDKVDPGKYKMLFSSAKRANSRILKKSIFAIVEDYYPLKFLKKTPEEVLLSPQDKTIEEHHRPGSRLKESDYYKRKKDLRELNVSYDEVMLYFILLITIRENNLANLESDLNIVNNVKVRDPKQKEKRFEDDRKYCSDVIVSVGEFIELIKEKTQISVIPKQKSQKTLLSFLLSANSKERCLEYNGRGLFNYLRGCEYGGSPHLQSKASIYLVADYIVNNYALPDNIRYLDLRCAIDGYSKFKLQENPETALKNLKAGFDHFTKDKNIHVNIIVTAKRHKSDREFEKNVELILADKRKEDEADRDNKANEEEVKQQKKKKLAYFDLKRTKIVSFDLAGLEKGNRASKFRHHFVNLHKKCIPITIHAGEEDNSDAIWEAVYIANSQRLGHALSLVENKSLLDMVKERHIAVELCPVSNFLTSTNYSFNHSEVTSKIRQEYPLKKYMRENIIVTINTDNPFVSSSSLSQEYLFAAKISDGLTKWEVLKLIKNSFKSITIPKDEKRKLMNEIDREIYNLLLDEEY